MIFCFLSSDILICEVGSHVVRDPKSEVKVCLHAGSETSRCQFWKTDFIFSLFCFLKMHQLTPRIVKIHNCPSLLDPYRKNVVPSARSSEQPQLRSQLALQVFVQRLTECFFGCEGKWTLFSFTTFSQSSPLCRFCQVAELWCCFTWV